WILISDWDETITTTDTLHLVAEAAYEANHNVKLVPWADLSTAYVRDYTAYSHSFGPRTTIDRELEFLKAIRNVEIDSINRVEKACIFKNVKLEGLQKAAQKLTVRPGFNHVLDRCRNLKIRTAIMSVNWSCMFIQAAMQSRYGDCEDVDVYANEIEFSATGVGTGKLNAGQYSLKTGYDKLQLLKHLRGDRKVLYLGDSSGDLHPLLEADVGIIMGSKKSLLDTCNRIGITVKSIREAAPLISVTKKKDDEHILYNINDWQELV
ncbi:HAD-like domain-containing protein, partial [Lipomyces arxii]|uniref:HAD-like domain-containing protein n=1 Tax=Lipomyces arxii TaxID=56418 RepID=UPI0034CD0F20